MSQVSQIKCEKACRLQLLADLLIYTMIVMD